jgi:alpha-glucoside transport system substrate-binding protein
MSVPVRRRSVAIIGVAAAALLLAACGGSDSGSTASPSATNTDPACADYAEYGSHEGTKVTVFTSILPPEQQKFEDVVEAQFEECTGIDIVYEGSDQFEAQLPTRIPAATLPTSPSSRSPACSRSSSRQGGPKPAPQAVADNVDEYWNPAWKDYGTVDGTFYAAPLSSNMKSFVWYSPKVFADKGYTVPTTWDEMFALSDKMVDDGIKPWCGGIESGGATGWPATDWIEQLVLRQQGGEVYDKWISTSSCSTRPRSRRRWTPSRAG